MKARAVACALALAACGSQGAAKPSPTATPSAVAAELGCHQYCQQAGGYGGGAGGRPAGDFVRIRIRGTVALVGGALPVEIRCLEQQPCRGAILLDPAGGFPAGRSDLEVGGGQTRTIAVALTAEAMKAVRSRHRLRVDVLVDFGNPKCPPDAELPCVATRRVVIRG